MGLLAADCSYFRKTMADLDEEMRPQRETTQGGKFQFDLRFLFFLMGLTAVVCGISKWSGNWRFAPLIIVNGLLYWQMRPTKDAGSDLVLCFVLGMIIVLSQAPFTVILTEGAVYIVLTIATLLASINATLRGCRRSGVTAFLGVLAYCLYVIR